MGHAPRFFEFAFDDPPKVDSGCRRPASERVCERRLRAVDALERTADGRRRLTAVAA
jgi:hypothetical protein